MGRKGSQLASRVSIPLDQLSVLGSIDKTIIRRIVQRHLNEIRYCYDGEYHGRFGGSGSLVGQLVIAPTGKVVSAHIATSTLKNERLEGCVLNAIKRWEFPKTNSGGFALESLPFQFGMAGGKDVRDAKWTSALAIYRGTGSRLDRVAKLTAIVQAPDQAPLALAWWIVEKHLHGLGAGAAGYLLAAKLLRDEGLERDALRVLSELSPTDATLVARELRAWGKGDEAKRIETLAKAAEK